MSSGKPTSAAEVIWRPVLRLDQPTPGTERATFAGGVIEPTSDRARERMRLKKEAILARQAYRARPNGANEIQMIRAEMALDDFEAKRPDDAA